MSVQMKALCCVCGNLRTCSRPRNHQAENYWLTGPIDRQWHRETGDLKCSECGKVTRHALIHPDKDTFRDHAERITRLALGTTTDPLSDNSEVVSRIRAAYQQGRRMNPFLTHLWSGREKAAAREAGRTHVTTYCGEVVELPPEDEQFSIGPDDAAEPDEGNWDEEYQDDEGQWWVATACVDCYRVANELRMARRRTVLKDWLVQLLANENRVPDEHVDRLIAAFEATQQAKSQTKNTAQ